MEDLSFVAVCSVRKWCEQKRVTFLLGRLVYCACVYVYWFRESRFDVFGLGQLTCLCVGVTFVAFGEIRKCCLLTFRVFGEMREIGGKGKRFLCKLSVFILFCVLMNGF